MAIKAPPFQIVLIMASVGVLMIISWLSISSPEAREENKARTTLIYFLEALGRAPLERAGKELHPTVLRQYNPETLKKAIAALELQGPLMLKNLSEGEQTFEPRQWVWRLKTQPQTAEGQSTGAETPLIAFIQYPEEMKISRRWHVRSLCRPQKELDEVTRALIANANEANDASQAEDKTKSKFLSDKGQYVTTLKFLSDAPQRKQVYDVNVTTEPRLQSEVRWQDSRLILQWEATPGDDLNCRYVLQGYRMGGTIDAP